MPGGDGAVAHGPVLFSIDHGGKGGEVGDMTAGPGSAGSERRARIWPAAALVAVAGLAAYANSFFGAFQFDDIPAILGNASVRQLWPPWIPLAPPQGGMTSSGRPVLNLTFALNWAISGDRPWSYHALNLLIHLGAALALLGIVRRTLAFGGKFQVPSAKVQGPGGKVQSSESKLQGPGAQGKGQGAGGQGPRSMDQGPGGALVALSAALLWVVHPLTTEAVTYIAQRAESLAALAYLLTLYGFARSAGAPGGGRRWTALSVAACWLGVGVKEIVVSAPVAVLLYDRLFVAGSWAGAWRARRGYYLALAASWIPLAFLVAGTGWDRSGTFAAGAAWGRYWLSQGEAVARYAALCAWPHPLALEYGPPTAPPWLAAILAAIVLAGVGVTLAACLRGRPWSFLPAIGILVLAPTSVIPSALQFAAEHRMYLPLAAALTALVLGVEAPMARRGWPRVAAGALLGLAALALAAATVARNRLYRDDLLLWSDNAATKPDSPVAQANVGNCLLERGRGAEALPYCERAVALDPTKPAAHYNLGIAYEGAQRWADALAEYVAALRRNPRLYPAGIKASGVLLRLGRPTEAEQVLHEAVAAAPDTPEAHGDLAVVLLLRRDWAGARAECERSLRLKPDQPEREYDLGVALAGGGNLEGAAAHFAAAARMQPGYGDAQLELGLSLARLGRLSEALAPLQAAVRLLPASARAHATLATALDQLGRTDEAIAEFQRSLERDPNAADAHYNLGNALIHSRQLRAARAQFEEALRLDPQFAAAREMLERLAAAPATP